MRAAGFPLFSLETRHPLAQFDVIGFSLSCELTYSNVLNMLDLAGLPVLACERDESSPLVIAGGSGALNPEPLADFIDVFALGDGEELVLDLVEVLREWKRQGGGPRRELLRRLARIAGLLRAQLLCGRLQRRRHHQGDPAQRTRGAGSAAQALSVRQRRIAARSDAAHRALPPDRPRPGRHRDTARLHPGLSLLPGRHDLPPAAGACARGGGGDRSRAPGQHRLSTSSPWSR